MHYSDINIFPCKYDSHCNARHICYLCLFISIYLSIYLSIIYNNISKASNKIIRYISDTYSNFVHSTHKHIKIESLM